MFNLVTRRLHRSPSIKTFTTTSKLFASKSGDEPMLKTALYDFHLSEQAKMAPFAGYQMPIQYGSVSITQSHMHTRNHVSIFDVSHMLQSEVHGKDRIEFIESLVTGDIQGLTEGTGTLTLFTNHQGGIIDDLIVTKTKEDHLYVVSNAGCRDKDLHLMKNGVAKMRSEGKDVTLVTKDNMSLIAVQGPAMQKVLQPLVPKINLAELYFMNSVSATVAGVDGCRITRCGYTGEDGVEISMPNEKAVEITQTLLASNVDKVLLAGLGARDSLRLEAGLCLYGSDMDEETTPVEAGLAWLLGKRRKEAANFPGAAKILQQIKDKKVKRRRVGFCSFSGPPPRHGMEIVTIEGQTIGTVTSGVPSPSLSKNIAMGYVEGENHKMGTKLQIKVRNKLVPVEVVKMPFLKGKYHMPPKK